MKPFIYLFAAAALLTSPALLNAKITRNVEKSFEVRAGGKLKIQTSGGDIKVVTHAGDGVKVTAIQRINTDSETTADEILKALELTIEQSGNDVTAIAKYERPSGFQWGSGTPVAVSFTVAVPTRYNVDLNTSGGDIQLENIEGQARLRTSGGDLKLSRVDGDVDGRTSGGDITLQEGTAKVKLSTSGGDIEVDRAGGDTEVDTSGGDIEVRSVLGRLSAKTSGGNVQARIEGSLKGDCTLSTSGGKVTVGVSPTAAFALKARTSGGNIDASGLEVAIDSGGLRKSKLEGKVNGGGPLLSLSSSGGNIRVTAN